jgi:hypothetical protein
LRERNKNPVNASSNEVVAPQSLFLGKLTGENKMLIRQIESRNGILELHHLGKISLGVDIKNPAPKEPIPNWEKNVAFGPIYFDEFIRRKVEHDFYYTYERVQQRGGLVEKVSFTKPVKLLKNKIVWARHVMLAGLIPNQHPAVTNCDDDEEMSAFDIPLGTRSFYGWEYLKISGKRGVRRKVDDGGCYSSLIPRGRERYVAEFIPSDMYAPLFKWAPLYVLSVLDMAEAGDVTGAGKDLLKPVMPGYWEHFIPRTSQRLLTCGQCS